MKETETVPGFIVACMTCHGQLGERADTQAQAEALAKTHIFGGGNKDHTGHTVTITPTQIVRKK